LSERVTVGTDIEFIRHLKAHGGSTMKKCFQCASCSVACELSPKEYAFPRKEMIQAAWGLKDKLMGDPDIWLCHGCMDCSQQCPRGARPADLMSALRSYVYRNFAVPKFMGKALSEPKSLPYLILFAAGMILTLVIATNAIMFNFDMDFFAVRDGVLKFDSFINKLSIQALFIPGNFLIFYLAGRGFWNYWKAMENHSEDETIMSFPMAAFKVMTDFFLHKKFDRCPTNSNRFYGHIYTFYGFMGTMIATGIVVIAEMYEIGVHLDIKFLQAITFPLPYPMPMDHWVKILGMVSGVFLTIGLTMLMIKRYKTDKKDGISTYNDWLFLGIIFSVGFTGMLSVFGRMVDVAAVAYIIYFVHLTSVFMLLWYMPFSKFAHMPYRFLGLVFLKTRGREHKPEVFK